MNTFIKKFLLTDFRELIAKFTIFSAIFLMLADTIYMSVNGITAENRELCVIYSFLPRWLFLIYEYLIELVITVLIGIFAGVLIEQHSKKLKRFYPKNPLLAFIYASVIPVCSCGVIPVIESLKRQLNVRSVITFVIAAPLLNPYIVFLSFTVLGAKYAIIRILASMLVAILSGYIFEFLFKFMKMDFKGAYTNCETSCTLFSDNIYVKTMQMARKILPYILIAGLLTLGFEIFSPKKFLEEFAFNNEAISMSIMLIVGIPIYVCNGADVLFLKPLMAYTDLSMGSAMVFSLASSAICISSIVMLFKFIGKKATFLLLAVISLLIIASSLLINMLY